MSEGSLVISTLSTVSQEQYISERCSLIGFSLDMPDSLIWLSREST